MYVMSLSQRGKGRLVFAKPRSADEFRYVAQASLDAF